MPNSASSCILQVRISTSRGTSGVLPRGRTVVCNDCRFNAASRGGAVCDSVESGAIPCKGFLGAVRITQHAEQTPDDSRQ